MTTDLENSARYYSSDSHLVYHSQVLLIRLPPFERHSSSSDLLVYHKQVILTRPPPFVPESGPTPQTPALCTTIWYYSSYTHLVYHSKEQSTDYSSDILVYHSKVLLLRLQHFVSKPGTAPQLPTLCTTVRYFSSDSHLVYHSQIVLLRPSPRVPPRAFLSIFLSI